MQIIAFKPFLLLSLGYIIALTNFCSKNSTQHSGFNTNKTIHYHRVEEPVEKSFSFLLPEGWKISGGLTRINAFAGNKSVTSNGAKLYLKVVSPDEKSSIGWLPDNKFHDNQRYQREKVRRLPLNEIKYNGLESKTVLSPKDFVLQVAVPFAHPHAQNIQHINTLYLNELPEKYSQLTLKQPSLFSAEYSAAIITMQYVENGISFLEKMVCVIEDYSSSGGGLWGNRETWYIRTETKDFNKMAPVISKICNSFLFNHEWLEKEIREELISNEFELKDQPDIQAIEKEISKHKTKAIKVIIQKMYGSLSEK